MTLSIPPLAKVVTHVAAAPTVVPIAREIIPLARVVQAVPIARVVRDETVPLPRMRLPQGPSKPNSHPKEITRQVPQRRETAPPKAAPAKTGLAALIAVIIKGGFVAFKSFVPVWDTVFAAAKTLLSMLLSIWAYAQFFGWQFAIGFVLLIFIHEMGHVYAAQMMKVPVSAPVFIPFLGAHILLQRQPQNAWSEAVIGIGGPILGTLGALACECLYRLGHGQIWMALATSGYMLNLFNMIPLTPLDGGRIVTALSPWLWLIGLACMSYVSYLSGFNLVIMMILFAALPKVYRLFKTQTDEEKRYLDIPSYQRWIMGAAYVGLVIFLLLAQNRLAPLMGPAAAR
jgi:Zn-dependent protease